MYNNVTKLHNNKTNFDPTVNAAYEFAGSK
jgi:hypothetical protein